jgi:hypothetical protein
MLNGSILNVASIIKNVFPSAAKSEVGPCFHNAQSGAPLRATLTELGHTQPPTPLHTDNSTAVSILDQTIKQKDPTQWTCDTIGEQTGSAKINLTFIGDQGVKI